MISYTENGKDKDVDWKFCLSDTAVHNAVKFYHMLLNHPEKQRLLQGMHRYFHPDLRKIIDNFHCDACQKYKVDGRCFGHLPTCDVRTTPFDTDIFGSWKVQTRTRRIHEFSALTSIYRVTGLVEVIRILRQENI